MTRAETVGVCLVGALVLSMFAGASASAEPPDFGRCLPLAGGKFKDGGCKKASVPGEERFEWYPGFSGAKPIVKTGFTLRAKPETLVEFSTAVAQEKMLCTGVTGSGSYTGSKTVSLPVLALTGCEVSGIACTTAGRSPGEVVLNALVGELGVIKKGTEPVRTTVGLDLRPASGSEVTQFSCGAIPVKWRGSVIVAVAANAMKLSTTLKLVATEGKQKPERFEGGERDVLEQSTGGAPFAQLGWTATLIQANEERIEVSTVN